MKKYLFSMLAFIFPSLSFADTYLNFNYLSIVLYQFKGLLNTGIVVLISLAVVWFFWNIFGYIRSADENSKTEAAKGMLWGIVGLAVIFSVWGLVALLQSNFGLSSQLNNEHKIRSIFQ